MVVETRRGKRKENPTEEEGPRVKFTKMGSGENVKNTTTEESETRAVEAVESTAKTTDELMAKTTDVSMEMTQTTDVSTEKTRQDSSENTAEMTEPFNVVAEAAPTTLNKGPGDKENEETASGDEENEETAYVDEENEETASGDEVNEKTASGDEGIEGSEEEQEKPDGEKESSNQDHEDSEEEPPDRENEVNARSEEKQANGEGEEEANENGNPPGPQAIPKLGLAFREPVEEADVNCPRMCKSSFKRNGMTWVSLSAINKELSNTTVKAGEQSIQLGDVMKLVKRTLKLMRTVDKKVDQLDGRLAPLEKFVKEAQAKAAEEEEAPAQEKAKKHKRRKK
ncbi:hypothetical protein DY000_02062857 [Brassica cretica]|uniref:Uncharacterized protein n=1 Tax=Brassica cretica TaxID=69181 RepID=A0ABQ7B3P1_BRACR|nr:hypothetical protein DY000_02062857 [Brassica cretica]